MGDMSHEITKTLESIFIYTGTDIKYATYAQLHQYLEWLIKKALEGK